MCVCVYETPGLAYVFIISLLVSHVFNIVRGQIEHFNSTICAVSTITTGKILVLILLSPKVHLFFQFTLKYYFNSSVYPH